MKYSFFRPHHHFPKISALLLKSLLTPLLIYFTLLGNALMFACAYVFWILEKDINPQVTGYGDALWWALCTVSTVGYGDIHPFTGGGRLTGGFLILTGVMCFLGSLAVLVSVMTTLLNEDQVRRGRGHI